MVHEGVKYKLIVTVEYYDTLKRIARIAIVPFMI